LRRFFDFQILAQEQLMAETGQLSIASWQHGIEQSPFFATAILSSPISKMSGHTEAHTPQPMQVSGSTFAFIFPPWSF
jgi:hypothetical protein